MAGNSAAIQSFDAGISVYTSKCIICHSSGVAGAPKLGDKAAGATRIASTVDILFPNAIQGKNAMPPRAT